MIKNSLVLFHSDDDRSEQNKVQVRQSYRNLAQSFVGKKCISLIIFYFNKTEPSEFQKVVNMKAF